MSQPIPNNHWSQAGKGDHERPVNRSVFRQNIDAIKKGPMRGKAVAVKGGKTTYKY
jgi:hypothetical protein